jgi:PleD family two-component response regulator
VALAGTKKTERSAQSAKARARFQTKNDHARRSSCAMQEESKKKILFVDLDDTRRKTRVRMLTAAGYDVEVRADHEVSEALDHELTFDLIIITLHVKKLDDAAAYSDRLRKKHPNLPILLLTDAGVFVPRGTLSHSMETGAPVEVMRQIAEMLAGSTHIRELKGEGVG